MTVALLEGACPACGIPSDAHYFDDSRIVAAPNVAGDEVILAQYALHPSYCGELQYFAQFTDAFALNPAEVSTPDLEWQIRSDGEPLAPWLSFNRIINPWGMAGFPLHVRLREGTLLEFVVRFVGSPVVILSAVGAPVSRVGGRLLGRTWYNPAFGGH